MDDICQSLFIQQSLACYQPDSLPSWQAGNMPPPLLSHNTSKCVGGASRIAGLDGLVQGTKQLQYSQSFWPAGRALRSGRLMAPPAVLLHCADALIPAQRVLGQADH